jgi:hypothetical protein
MFTNPGRVWSGSAARAGYHASNGCDGYNYNWLSGDGGSATPVDGNGRGTHTMGTMVGDDGGGNQIGMAPGATWVACEGFPNGSCTLSALLTCAQWVAAPYPVGDPGSPDPSKRPHVVNNSWGDCAQWYDSWYQGVVDSWHAAGIYPIFANVNAGNCGEEGPGNVPNMATGWGEIDALAAVMQAAAFCGITWEIFADDFENGTSDAWSTTAP